MKLFFGSILLAFCNAFNSYGWAILMFGLIVKVIMLPFQMKSKKSMMRTTMLQPRMKELERQCGSNKQKYQEEVAKLYKEAKVNPLSGCLWTLIPFPVLIILYSVVRQPLTTLMKLTSDEIATLTQAVTNMGLYEAPARANAYAEMSIANILSQNYSAVTANSAVAGFVDKLSHINFSFLGMNMTRTPNLFFWNDAAEIGMFAAFILFLIPFISAGLTVLQSKLTQATTQNDPQAAATAKSMNMVMPLMSVYICFIMPAAMGIYWIEQSVLGIIQEAILNKFYQGKLDEEMREFNEAQRKKEEALAAKRAETERLKAEGKTVVNASTSKKRLAGQERNAERQKEAAFRAAEAAAKGITEELPPSQVGNRRYARGRAYDPDRYAAEAAVAEAAEAPEAEVSAVEGE